MVVAAIDRIGRTPSAPYGLWTSRKGETGGQGTTGENSSSERTPPSQQVRGQHQVGRLGGALPRKFEGIQSLGISTERARSTRRNEGLTLQQQLGARFEEFLLEHMTALGMAVTRNPELRNGKTPDFLVEHEGRICYVEATHIQVHPAFREMSGETDLKEFLNAELPEDRVLVLRYEADDAQPRLNSSLSPRDKEVRDIARWARDMEPGDQGAMCAQIFPVKGVLIEAQLFKASVEGSDRVGWVRGYTSYGNRSGDIRASLREKYRKYTPTPDSLGDVPLIVAVLTYMMLRSEMEEALYGQIDWRVILRRGSTPVVEPRFRRIPDGVWWNRRNGTPQVRHQHLAGVWQFQSMGDQAGLGCLFPNPFRKDLDSIIPAPMPSDRSVGI